MVIFDIRIQKTGRGISEDFNLSKHSITDFKVVTFKKKSLFNRTIEQDIDELIYIKRLQAISVLNNSMEF